MITWTLAQPTQQEGLNLSDAQLIGRRVGDLRILKVLGRGGMGTVYLAEGVKRSAGHRVAVKVIAPHIAGQPQVSARFEAEARAVTRIDHPNVIRIHDYGVLSDGTLFHVMELLEGRELQLLLEERPPLSALQAAPFVDQICAGLGAAHDSGVVHRDLKPENIIILRERPLSLKLIDFGIAKLLDPDDWVQLTVTGMVMGTPVFIAPEQAMGDRARVGPRTDIYSLGVVLYTMLAGEPPFDSVAVGLLLSQHIKEPPPPLLERRPELPPAVARVVHRCLEKDPAARFDSAQALAEAYLQALGSGLERSDRREGQDTICDEQPPAHMPPPPRRGDLEAATIVDPVTRVEAATIVDPATHVEAATIVDPEPFTPAPLLAPAATPTRRWSREMLAIGLAAGAILLIVMLLALTAYLVST